MVGYLVLFKSCNKIYTGIFSKVKLSLCLTKHHAMKYWEGRYSTTHLLTSALEGGEWSASCPGRFTPALETAPSIHSIGGWMGP